MKNGLINSTGCNLKKKILSHLLEPLTSTPIKGTKINKINWDYEADIWSSVLRKDDGKIENGKSARKRAAAMIIYMIMAHELDETQQHTIYY